MQNNQIAIIDYGMGNLFNVQCACEKVGIRSIITSDKDVIMRSRGVILPGVGAFGDAMQNLRKLDLVGVIRDHIGAQKPFLGICLGMQLLLTESEEFGGHKGLDIVKGHVVRLKNRDHQNQMVKVPQVGWNRIHFKEGRLGPQGELLSQQIADGEYMYFVHSYYAQPEKKSVVFTKTRYEDTEYCSSVVEGSVFAVQFHPEKSGIEGLKIYKNWALTLPVQGELMKR